MTYQDVMINGQLGFAASTWRSNGNAAPSYLNNAGTPTSPITYVGPYYTADSADAQALLNSRINLDSIYGAVFWDTFFETVFPSLNQADFLAELSTGTPGGYFKQLYNVAARDFYDSFFQGRDDSGSHGVGTTDVAGDTSVWWEALSYDQQRLVVKKFLLSRAVNTPNQTYFNGNGALVNRAYTDIMLMDQLSLRTTNIFVYLARLLVDIMQELQSNTINASSYATKLAQTQQSISTEMTKSTYYYKTLGSANDYVTQSINENNGSKLESMRTMRDLLQKETDQVSSYLETSQQSVSDSAGKALEFLKKGSELNRLFFKSF